MFDDLESYDELGEENDLTLLRMKADNYLHSSILDTTHKKHYERMIDEASEKELVEIIDYLKNNQIDRIASGLKYNQSDIINKLGWI